MSDPSLALQIALVAALRAAETEAGDDVYDTVPDADPFPRITVGGGQSIPVEADCYDGTETFLQVDVWSRDVGYPQVKRIASDVRALLHNGDLTVTGHRLELLKVESIVYERDRDFSASRARITVRAQTQPAD